MSSPNLPPRRDRSPSVSRNTQSRRHVRASKPPVSPQSLLVEDETKPFISVSPSGEFSGSGTDPMKPATSGQEVMHSESSLSSTASSQFNLPAATVTSSGNFDPGFEPPDDVGNKCNSHARTSSSEEGRRPAISVSSNSPAASRSHRDSTIVVPPTLPVAAPPSNLTATAKVDIIAASPNTPSFTSANVFGRIKRIIDAKRKFMDTRSRRFDRLMAQLPFDVNGKVEAVAACRVFLACGVTMPSSLANPLAAQSLSRDDVVKLLEGKEEEIAGMEHLDNIGDDLGDDERNTVAASRIVISSRISAFARKTRTSGWLLHQALDILHYVSMLFHFIVVSLYCVVYLDREPKQLYGVLWGIWALWVLDIVWTLHSPVTDANGKVVDSPWLIAWEKRFILSLDVLCVLPMDMILYPMCESKSQFNPFDSSHRILAAFLILRYLKLAKPIRILWLFQFEKLDVITPTFVTFFFLIKPMLRILAVVIITIQTLVVIDYIVHQGALTDVYLDNLVDIMSMVSGAGINVAFEGPSGTVFEIFLMCCGLIAQAAVISNLSVTVFRNDVNALNVQQMRETLSILEHFSVPADVSTEILSYQLHALSDDVSVRLATLDTLPAKMQKEVMLYVKVAAVNTVKLFSKATHDCKMKIADSLIQTVVAPNTDIVAIGDIGEEMFLIAHGYASVIIFNGVTVAMLSRGDYFGEVALLLPNNVRQATVRALTYCDLWELDKTSFLDILREFPSLLLAMEDDLKAKGINVLELDFSTTPHISNNTQATPQEESLPVVQLEVVTPRNNKKDAIHLQDQHQHQGDRRRSASDEKRPSLLTATHVARSDSTVSNHSPLQARLSMSGNSANGVALRSPAAKVAANVRPKYNASQMLELDDEDEDDDVVRRRSVLPYLGERVTVMTKGDKGTIRRTRPSARNLSRKTSADRQQPATARDEAAPMSLQRLGQHRSQSVVSVNGEEASPLLPPLNSDLFHSASPPEKQTSDAQAAVVADLRKQLEEAVALIEFLMTEYKPMDGEEYLKVASVPSEYSMSRR